MLPLFSISSHPCITGWVETRCINRVLQAVSYPLTLSAFPVFQGIFKQGFYRLDILLSRCPNNSIMALKGKLLQCRQKYRQVYHRRTILSTQLLISKKIFEILLIWQTQQNVMQSMFSFVHLYCIFSLTIAVACSYWDHLLTTGSCYHKSP